MDLVHLHKTTNAFTFWSVKSLTSTHAWLHQTTKATPWRLFLNSYVLKSRTVRFQVVRFLRTQTHESLTLMFRLHKETLDMLFAEILCYSLGDQESWQLRRCAHQVSPSTVTVMCTSSSWVLFSCAALPCSVVSFQPLLIKATNPFEV